MGFCVNDDHDTKASLGVSRSVTRAPVCVGVLHRVVLFCVCGRYGCVGICGGCKSSCSARCLTIVTGGGSAPRELGVGGAWSLVFDPIFLCFTFA